MEKINQCPFCGSDETTSFYFFGEPMVGCGSCNAHGPEAHTFDRAIELWNAAANQLEQLRNGIDEASAERDAIARDYDNERNAATIMRAELNEQLKIATNLGSKRWKALNEIYIGAEKRTANWCRRKAAEGLGLEHNYGTEME